MGCTKKIIEQWLSAGAPRVTEGDPLLSTGPVTIEREPDNVHVAWDDGRRFASLDRWQDGGLEWFFMDRDTQQAEGSDGACLMTLPDVFFELLQRP